MNRLLRNSLLSRGVGFDVETHKTQRGLAAPPLVCGAISWVDPETGKILSKLLSKEDTLQHFIWLLESDRIIVGANIAYDFLVCAVEWAKRGRDVFPLIYRKFARDEIYDILVAEQLNAIADGTLGEDPVRGGKLRDPLTNELSGYSLAIVTWLRFGRTNAKANDEWRLKYALLDGVPIEDYPPAASQYPQDDVRNTLESALGQCGLVPCLTRHQWREYQDGQTVCVLCGVPVLGSTSECWCLRPARNLHQVSDQTATAWALSVGGAWGFDVDQEATTAEEQRVLAIREKAAPPLIAAGFLRWKKEKGVLKLCKNKSKIGRALALAYGASGECVVCKGHGKVVSANKKMPVRRAWDPEKDGINCNDCCGTGFDLTTCPSLVLTDPSGKFPEGQVSAKADALNESGDDVLIALADYDEFAKTISNYVPYLREARRLNAQWQWLGVPLTLWPNVLLVTDRVSYHGAIQQFPRDGALRACIRARKGHVLCSADYNQGEVVTHAQSCIWIVGHSVQAQLLLAGQDPHSALAATVLGLPYEEFFKRKKEKKLSDARQASKPWVFGKPGGMGAAKIVANQRAQGPDTICPGGPALVDDGTDTETFVQGYRGMRFCILMDGATSCGSTKVRRWGKGDWARDIDPTCLQCLECAERLQAQWFETFPEAKPYFKFTSSVVENGQPLTDEQCDIHGLPHGSQLEPGEQCYHVSNIIAGGKIFTDCSNSYFQSLLAVASKRAMRIAQQECLDSTILVPTDVCKGGTISRFAGQRSPLYGNRCVVLQHDEIIAELKEEIAHEAANRLSEIMIRCLQEVCPDLARVCKAPPALMRRWLKKAEPWWERGGEKPADENDRLTPWEPKPKRGNKQVA